jgi:hypothetical protein
LITAGKNRLAALLRMSSSVAGLASGAMGNSSAEGSSGLGAVETAFIGALEALERAGSVAKRVSNRITIATDDSFMYTLFSKARVETNLRNW